MVAKVSRGRGALALSVSLFAIAMANPAFGQTTPTPSLPSDTQAPGKNNAGEEPQEIVVTGSRIAQRGYDTVQPVLVLDSKQIEARGFTTLGQALSEQPAFGIADSSPVGGQSSLGPGQSFVNFFGLGSQRTLTLVNGRRFVGSNTAAIFGPTGSGGDQVDLNVIPTKLIDRVETVAVGGAPIYGSDAIAGTINVILKKNYQGVDLDAQYGISDRADAPEYRLRLLAGQNFAGGRGNITFAGEYNEAKGLLYTDRDLAGQGRYYDDPLDSNYPFKQQFYPDRRIPSTSEGGTPLVGSVMSQILGANVLLSPALQQAFFGGPFSEGVSGGVPYQALKFDQNGNLEPINFGTSTSVVNSSGGNGYSLTNLSNLLTNTKRYSAIMTGSFAFNDHLRLSAEGWYSHSEGTNLRDQPEYNGGLFGNPGDPSGQVVLSVNNPYLTPTARTAIINEINSNPLSDQNAFGVNQDYFFLDRANTDLTTGRVQGKVDIFRAVVALEGDFNVFGDKNWKWELAGNYGRSETKSEIPTINTQNFLNATGAITTANPNGIPCLAGLPSSGGPTITSTCAGLNLFGYGASSQAARNYVTMIATPDSVNEQKDFTASLTGALFKLPGGDFSFALGYEHREEHEKFDPSAAYLGAPDTDPTVDSNGDGNPTNDVTAYGQTVPFAPIDAGYHTNEVYGELQADLIGPEQHIPLVRTLELQGAVRYVNNSVNGGAVTYTGGGRWSPVNGLTVRGNFTHSIRSPSITENQNPAQSYFGFAVDPCDAKNVTSGPNPAARQKNCTAALTAAGLTPAQIADFGSLSNDRSFLQGVAGDASLKNEAANSFTVGGVIQPRFVRGLTVSADYVNIAVKNVITSQSSDDVLSACYDSASYPNNPFCARQVRDNTGQVSYLVTGYVNADQLHYRGIVAQGEYRTATGFLGANSSVGFGVSYQHLFELSSTTAGTKTKTAGNAGYSVDKGTLSVTYDNSGFEYFLQLAYLGPAAIDVNAAPDYYPQNHYNKVVFTNMAISYAVNKQFQFRLNVDNVFDTKPPFPSSGTSDVYFRGALGRYYHVGAAVHF